MKKLFLAFLAAMLLSGCASAPQKAHVPVPDYEAIISQYDVDVMKSLKEEQDENIAQYAACMQKNNQDYGKCSYLNTPPMIVDNQRNITVDGMRYHCYDYLGETYCKSR